jgi:hypothetical protein
MSSDIKLLPFHSLADKFPLMSDDEFFGLVRDIEKNGQRQEIDTWQGMILEGRHRAKACQQLGIEPRYRECRFESEAGALAYVISQNIHRRHLTPEQRRDVIATLLEANPEKSDRAIADDMKVDKNVVARVRKKMEATGAVAPVEKRTGKDGKARKGQDKVGKTPRKPPRAAEKPRQAGKQSEAIEPSSASTVAANGAVGQEHSDAPSPSAIAESATGGQAPSKTQEVTALEIERFASKLVGNNRELASALYRLLGELHSVEWLAAALERALEQATCNGFESDGLDIPNYLRRAAP